MYLGKNCIKAIKLKLIVMLEKIVENIIYTSANSVRISDLGMSIPI